MAQGSRHHGLTPPGTPSGTGGVTVSETTRPAPILDTMSDLADLVEAYKREVAIPGTFSDVYPKTSDALIAAALADAFAQAQLDGFFGTSVLVVDQGTVTPDLSTAGAALVILYAGIRLTRQQLRTVRTRTTYKAGSVEYTSEQAASAVTEDLKLLEARRRELLALALRAGRGTSTVVVDAYAARFWAGFLPWELRRYGDLAGAI